MTVSGGGETNTANNTVGDVTTIDPSAPPQYQFTGFFTPVSNPPVINVAKAGSGVAIKFSLSGNQGLDIFGTGSPASVPLVGGGCPTGGGGSEPTSPAGKSGLSYNPTTDTYSYNWKTQKPWKGTCRQFVLVLNDGSTHVAFFQFK